MRQNPYAKGTDQWRAWAAGYTACHNEWRDSALEEIRKRNKPKRFRDSILGRFITKAKVLASPATTQGESR